MTGQNHSSSTTAIVSGGPASPAPNPFPAVSFRQFSMPYAGLTVIINCGVRPKVDNYGLTPRILHPLSFHSGPHLEKKRNFSLAERRILVRYFLTGQVSRPGDAEGLCGCADGGRLSRNWQPGDHLPFWGQGVPRPAMWGYLSAAEQPTLPRCCGQVRFGTIGCGYPARKRRCNGASSFLVPSSRQSPVFLSALDMAVSFRN